MLLGAILFLAGCGIPQADYDAVTAQSAALEAEKAALQAEKSSLQNEISGLTATKDSLEDENGQLNAQLASLQADYDETAGELASLQSKYPPRDFTSRMELENWLLGDPVSQKPLATDAETWINRALEVQANALADGYIINMDYDYDDTSGLYSVFCTAIIQGEIWFWDPETDVIQRDATLSSVK